jgi:hypothetical protein
MYRLYRHYQRCRKPYANLYQTIPTNEDYNVDVRTKNGNIIAVVDKKKESIVQYLKQYQKEFRSSLSKKTEVCLESLKVFWKGKIYVVMETGNTWMIKLL